MIALTVQTFGPSVAELGGVWLLGGLLVVAAGCGVIGALARHKATRLIFGVLVAALLVGQPIARGVIVKWDCGDLPWWLCWLVRHTIG